MHKKKVVLIILFAVLLLSLAAPNLVGLTTANPMYLIWYPREPIKTPPVIAVQSPLQEENVNSTLAWLNFTVTKPSKWFTQASWEGYEPERYLVCVRLISYYYTLDGNVSQRFGVDDKFHFVDNPVKLEETMSFSTNLPLKEGPHNIKVTVECESAYFIPADLSGDPIGTVRTFTSSDTVSFDAVRAPKIYVLSLQNMTFNSTSVDLSFFVDEPTPRIAYSLDEQANVTVAGNTTLTDLPVGGHNVTVYAWDVYGNVGASEPVHFAIAIPDSLPTVPVVVGSTTLVAVVCAGFLIYLKKRGHANKYNIERQTK